MPESHCKDLPPIIPIFPLSGALLLPGGQLPLNIFEPRYIAMTDYVLGNSRFLGMVQVKDESSKSKIKHNTLYNIGCLGRMSAFAEVEDGRYIITLSGVVRFKIVAELETVDEWRSVKVDYKPFSVDLINKGVQNFERQSFLDALQAFFSMHNIKGSWDSIEKVDEATLITTVAMAAPLSPEEKQAILECESLLEQGRMLQTLMEMAVHRKVGGAVKFHH